MSIPRQWDCWKSYLMVPLLFPLGMGMLNKFSAQIVQPALQVKDEVFLLIGHGCSAHALSKWLANALAEYVMNVNLQPEEVDCSGCTFHSHVLTID